MAYQRALRHHPAMLEQWEEGGQAKVVLKVETERELLELATMARNLGLITSLVCDAGRTQIAPGSKTVLGIGPGPVKIVDRVSGRLKLFWERECVYWYDSDRVTDMFMYLITQEGDITYFSIIWKCVLLNEALLKSW